MAKISRLEITRFIDDDDVANVVTGRKRHQLPELCYPVKGTWNITTKDDMDGHSCWCLCVFITAVPITKLFSWGVDRDSGGHVYLCVFITAVPITKLFVWGEAEDSGGHVLRETTSRGLSGLV